MGRDDDLVLDDLGVAPRLIHSDHFHLVLIDLEEMPPQAQVHGSRLNLVWLDGLDDPLSGFQQAYQGRSGKDHLPCEREPCRDGGIRNLRRGKVRLEAGKVGLCSREACKAVLRAVGIQPYSNLASSSSSVSLQSMQSVVTGRASRR